MRAGDERACPTIAQITRMEQSVSLRGTTLMQTDRFTLPMYALLLLAALSAAGSPLRAHVKPAGRIMVITHIDVIPDAYIPGNEEKAQAAFREQATATKADAGLVSYAFFQEAGGGNHFTLVEVWATPADFAAHEGAKHTIAFRTVLQPLLGSPFDQRVNVEFK